MVSVVTLAPRGQFFGVTSQQVATAKAELALPDKYILALGRINKRKNLCALLAGANRANLVTPELPLVLAGPTSGQQEEGLGELLKELGPRARKIGFVPEELIAGLVGGARIMVSLSVVEGFGLPPLEGLAAGVPVLMARSAVANEIMGDAAVFVSDIRDPSEVARALDSLLTSEELREEMAARGRVQLERYSWSRSGAELSSAIDRALVRKVKRNERKTQGTEEKSP
jgi:glycosyltransferase involved in cell wall biosynthesis